MYNKNKLQALSFAIYEAILYLDTHPCDKRAILYYEKLKKEYVAVLAQYEKTNGAVTAMSDCTVQNGNWTWSTTPWPWQNCKV